MSTAMKDLGEAPARHEGGATETGWDADVVVVGSGFGGSVAALRFVEAGEKVLVLERGTWVTREGFEPDIDALWLPHRNAFGFHDLHKRGDTLIPWLGAAIGGGSHVYAGTLKRREAFDDLPGGITPAEMDRHYRTAEDMMAATPYPDYPPYDRVRATQLCFRAGARLERQHPELVQAWGPIPLGISFAPREGGAGRPFVNKHGAPQRYQDPREQSILGGDIECKNTLDKNYLFLARKRGARIEPFHEVDRIAPLEGGGYLVSCRVYVPERGARGLLRRWFPRLFSPNHRTAQYRARRVVVAAGAVGSSELLLRNRDVHRTLPRLGQRLGERYTTNGDYITLIIPFREMLLAWLGFAAAVAAVAAGHLAWAIPGLVLYYWALARSPRPFDPDLGTTNSDYVRFVGRRGENQGAYIESGRYPNPGKSLLALFLSAFHAFRPRRYVALSRFAAVLRAVVPPFGALARTWPIPLLTMGADDAFGTVRLDAQGKAVIHYDAEANREYYRYVTGLGRLFAKAAHASFLPNLGYLLLHKLEIPHNLGGVPMGASPETGVVDDCGRVFGHDDLMVLDGSIIPASTRPNPALTILALSERAMERVVAQLREQGWIAAEAPAPAGAEAAAGKSAG